ncbi:hypothetical protein FRC17_004265 [Serendipita sp. 399]|nr:hypothetical protein FRC17_004265 [Serendipita sp. 399]
MTSPAQLDAFLDRQRHLLARERQEEIDQTSLLLSNCSPKLLEKKGLALLGLGVVNVNIGLGGKRPGDLARIEDASSSSDVPRKAGKSKETSKKEPSDGLDGVVYKVSNARIVIALDGAGSDNSDDLDIPEHCWVVKLANTITYDRMDHAVERMSKILLEIPGADGRTTMASSLIRVLFGLAEPSPPEDIGEIQFFNPDGLNESQKRAVKLALSSPEIALIHGPPGTGKTHTLVEVILQLASRKKRILVCGASNLAVDNLLERLIPHKIPLTRLGHPARVLNDLHTATLDFQAQRSDQAQLVDDIKKEIEDLMSNLAGTSKGKKVRGAERRKMYEEVKQLRKEYRKREASVVSRVVDDAKIVLATCHGAGGKQLVNRYFDVVIIDEAAQALEAVCWIPILKSTKLILAGDPLQLPPTVISLNGKKREDKGNVPKPTSVPKKASAKAPGKASTKAPSPVEPGDGTISDSTEDSTFDEKIGLDKPVQRPTKSKSAKECGWLRPSRSLEVTLFDRLEKMWGKEIKQMLDVQYRMNSTICSFPSETLYSSKLKSDATVANRLLSDIDPSDSAAQDTLGHPVVFFDTSGCEYFESVETAGASSKTKGLNDEGSKCNLNEVEIVKRWVEELVSCGVPPAEIAIVTPYQAQVTLLSASLSTIPGLEIGTVDGMQGREKDAVVISLVRSNDKREVGFLKEKRRLNVAMTRARKHLCVIGDSSTIKHGSSYLKKWMEWLEENADVRYAGDQ